MLKTKKSITLSGTSMVTSGETGVESTAVVMNASISETGTSNIVTNITNQTLYEANKAECRADMDAFTAEVRAIEDEE